MKTSKNLVKINEVPYIYLDMDLFEGTLEEVSSKVLGIKNMLADAIEKIDKQYESTKGRTPLLPITSYKEIRIRLANDYDTNYIVYIDCFREQTKEEHKLEELRNKMRVESAKKAAITRAKAKAKREKTLYENLKKKFENQKK
jgi:hypothetical protein